MNVRPVIWLALMSVTLSAQTPPLKYPDARKAAQVDDYFGTKIADPYRWLEDPDSPETRAWVEAENAVTFSYLDGIPQRAAIKARLTKLWNYERYGTPSLEGRWYIYSRNDGLQNQPVIYKTTEIAAAPEVLLDPNLLSADGTVALGEAAFSEDGRYMAYSLATAGSDWQEWRVREVETGKDLPDTLKWSKFSGAAWMKDGSGFYYCRYDAPKDGTLLQAVNKNQKLYFHRLGTTQDKDQLTYERPDKPDWGFSADVTDDGRFLLVYQNEGTENRNRIFIRDLKDPGGKVVPFIDGFDASYTVVGNDGEMFYILTDRDAPRYRLVVFNRRQMAQGAMTIIPQGKDVLQSVTMAREKFVTIWLTDAHNTIRVYELDGSNAKDVDLPAMGTVDQFHGRRKHGEAFYSFTSFIHPTTIYKYDFTQEASTVFRKPSVAFDASRYETEQVFAKSKDGTKVPIFVTRSKKTARNGQNPTQLYGYGGFNVPVTPSFSPAVAVWLEMGGVYAVAVLRGGGEYGRDWYDAGRGRNKQNVFNDFIAAAEFLVHEKYTSTPKLAIAGGSNGGLLVGACLTQRPDLFGAALPAVGVMDMLRYHKFTIGWAWKSDYGDPDTADGFATNVKYSPLHNIKPGTKYPATLVTTADHDDRVVPAHSFKFAAALQAAQAGAAPVLIRIETRAGHGAGKPTTKQIEEKTDVLGFLVKELKIASPALARAEAAK